MKLTNTGWQRYYRRSKKDGCKRLRRIHDFNNPVLVTGCQRSGTTMLTRVLSCSDGLKGISFSKDEELDTAEVLAGYRDFTPEGRYCLQTTFLNECYPEYYNINADYKLVFVLRNPYSVVRSMMANWRHSALNILFDSCGSELLEKDKGILYKYLGSYSISKIQKACLCYVSKTSQVFELRRKISKDEMLVLDYDDMVRNKTSVLPALYEWLDSSYQSDCAKMIRSGTLGKREEMSSLQTSIVKDRCLSVYEKSMELVDMRGNSPWRSTD